MSTALIAGVLVGLIIMVAGLFFLSKADKKNVVQDRVRKMAAAGDAFEDSKDDNKFLLQDTEPSALAKLMGSLIEMVGINMAEYKEQIGMKFLQAGVTSPSALIYYIFMKKFGIWIAAVVSLILLLARFEGPMKYIVILFAIISSVGTVLGADIYLTNRKQNRQIKLLKSFPDGLDLILVCVESGLALDGALSRVCKELERAHPVLTQELNKTRMELTLLNDRPRALQGLAERTDLVPFKALVGALMQAEKFGTSLTETLRVLSEDYRYTRMMIAENKAAKIPAAMTIVMMLTMIPALMMLIMGPAIIKVTEVWKQ